MLRSLIEPYFWLTKYKGAKQLQQIPDNLMYLLVGWGRATDAALFVWNKEGQQAMAQHSDNDLLLSRQHYEYLQREHGFQLESVSYVLFYKVDLILPLVFDKLITDRHRAESASQINLLKSLINLSCGFLGFKQRQGPNRQSCWLVDGINPHKCPVLTHYQLQDAGVFDNEGWFTRQQLAPIRRQVQPRYRGKSCPSALPIFATVIDLGKMRWGECYFFIRQVTRPHSVQLLYAHIDNMILALADTDLSLLVSSGARDRYLRDRDNYLSTNNGTHQPKPGQLKLEWTVCSEHWSFATPYSCFYSLLGGMGQAKTSSLNNLTSAQSFQYALQLLAGHTATVQQVRRTHKMSHTQSALVNLQLKPPARKILL